jgi:hypothetical protein
MFGKHSTICEVVCYGHNGVLRTTKAEYLHDLSFFQDLRDKCSHKSFS